jgi:SAM-dependent methyltransferase
MRSWLTPARRRGVEVLDDPSTPDEVRHRAMRDVTRSNILFGGTRAVVRAVRLAIGAGHGSLLVLDLGTGLGDIPARLRATEPKLAVVGLDSSVALLRSAHGRMTATVAANALQLPLRDGCVDVVICSQLLHHFEEGDARMLIREAHRVSRGWVVISDIRRSWAAAAGFWLASTALRFHPITRHDGVVSVLRGFTPEEMDTLIRAAVGASASMDRGIFWRITAVWRKAPAPAAMPYT